MKIVSFELTMPNRASWNGGWTGDANKYYIIKSFTDKSDLEFMKELPNSWYHNFGDGWTAKINAEIINSNEAAKRRKISKGFYGYEWMVTSIINQGTIEYKKHYAY